MLEKTLIDKMLSENKITQEEQALLLASMQNKTLNADLTYTYCINPFTKIAGIHAVILGFMITVILSFIEIPAKLFSVGTIGCLNATFVKNSDSLLAFPLLFMQNIVDSFALAFCFYIAALLCKQKHLRFIDFIGASMIARLPLLMLALSIILVKQFDHGFMVMNFARGWLPQISFTSTLSGGIIGLCFAWMSAMYFFALKEASGLQGRKLWLSFVVALIASEMIATPVTQWLML